jgi:hypothetical protein
VDRLKFLDVMLGDQPALTPPELVYQRMLARDSVEAAEQAEEFLKEKPLLTYYEEVLVEALKLAQTDADRGFLDDDRMLRIRDAVAEIVDDLSAYKDKADEGAAVEAEAKTDAPLAHMKSVEESLGRAAEKVPLSWRTGKPVLCIPGIGPLDEAFTLIVAQSIERQEIGVCAEQWDALSVSRVFSLNTDGVELVCLCYLASVTSAQIRYSVRRLRQNMPQNANISPVTRSVATRSSGHRTRWRSNWRGLARPACAALRSPSSIILANYRISAMRCCHVLRI